MACACARCRPRLHALRRNRHRAPARASGIGGFRPLQRRTARQRRDPPGLPFPGKQAGAARRRGQLYRQDGRGRAVVLLRRHRQRHGRAARHRSGERPACRVRAGTCWRRSSRRSCSGQPPRIMRISRRCSGPASRWNGASARPVRFTGPAIRPWNRCARSAGSETEISARSPKTTAGCSPMRRPQPQAGRSRSCRCFGSLRARGYA